MAGDSKISDLEFSENLKSTISKIPFSFQDNKRYKMGPTPLKYMMRGRNSNFPLVSRLANFNTNIGEHFSSVSFFNFFLDTFKTEGIYVQF